MTLPGWLTRNFRLKAIATAAAAITWTGVVYASNPPDTRSVSVKVPQDAAAVAPYVLVHPIPDLVVRVSGTREHLSAFTPADLVVSANYKAITHAGIQSVPLTVINNDRDVVMDNPPTAVVVDVDQLSSRTVPVTIVVDPPPPRGYVVSTESAAPSSVTLVGPAHQLGSVEARAIVDLSSWKTNFQADAKVVLVDITGRRVGDFAAIPQTVQVSLTVVASLTSRASAVLPRTTGSVAPGYQYAGIAVDPQTVVLVGPQDLLNTLDSVPTEAIPLNGLTSDRVFTVRVLPPSGVTAGPDSVTVRIHVIPAPQASPTPSPSPSPSPTPTATPSKP